MSVGEEKGPELKPFMRTYSGRIILFFQDTGEVRVEDVKAAKKTEYEGDVCKPRDKAPKMGKWVNVHENSSTEKHRGLVLTTLNLSKLGWANSLYRLIGRCNDIYVISHRQEGFPEPATVA